MELQRITRPVEQVLRIYAAVASAIVVAQLVGLVMALRRNALPFAGGEPSTASPLGTRALLALVVIAGFARALVWIRIYWNGSTVLAGMRQEARDADSRRALSSRLDRLTTLLIASFVLDLLFLPAYFLSDLLLPFPLSGWRLGVIEVVRVVFPQAFGVAALILAFLTRQLAHLVSERDRLHAEVELTI